MKVQVVTVDRAGGKKLCVQVVWQENGKTKKQNKEVFGLNERRKAEALRNKLENSEKIDAVDQKITFTDAFNSYIKVLEQGTLNTPEYIMMQIGYIKNHVAPHINQEYLSDYKMSDFKEFTLPKILNSKQLAWRTKDGREYYIKLDKTIGKKTIKEVVGEFKKFIKYCLEHSWKIDYSIMTFKFQKNFFTQYIKKKEWLPQSHELLNVINNEKNVKLKALYQLAAEAGPRANEVVAVCYDDIDFDNGKIHLNHSLDKWNKFRPFFLKTGLDNRDPIEATDKLLNLLDDWMKTQTFPKTLRNIVYEDPYTKKLQKRNFVRIFDLTKSRAAKKVKQSAKKLGIDWQSGLSPFRKWSISRMEDLKVLTEKQMDRRYGNTKEIRDSHYYKDLNLNVNERKAAINQITKG
tara:strand:+ start:339 stop:1553 length:1215 start_codon:yes stop_codon:yes gene_type:complete